MPTKPANPKSSRSPASTTSSRGAGRARANRTAHKPLQPFTVDHFRAYGRNLILDTGDPWPVEDFQAVVMEDLFSGVPELWMVVPEGNGKTTLMAGAALYHADYTPAAFVPIGASSRDQVGILLAQAAGFVYRSPGMSDRFRVFEGYRRIQALRTGGRIQVYAADDRTGDGIIPTLALLDELHRHRDMRLYRTWRGKLDKRDGQLAAISTAGEPETDFETTRERALAEADSVTRVGFHTRAASPEFVLHDWSVPQDGGDVEDMKAVKKANPFSGVTEAKLRTKRDSPTMTLGHWQRFVCNQATRTEDSAIAEAEWNAHLSSEGIPVGEPVWVGADFGWKHDTTAIVPLWMPSLDRRLFGDPQILTPPRDGTSMSPDTVQAAFVAIHERTPIHTVVMDENAGGAQMAFWIESELGAQVVMHSQSHTAMALAYERWMEALRARDEDDQPILWHTGHPEFARHVLNAIARVLPGGQVRFDRPAKSRSAATQDRRVWDALTAASMVHSTAVGNFNAPDKPAFNLDDYRIGVL